MNPLLRLIIIFVTFMHGAAILLSIASPFVNPKAAAKNFATLKINFQTIALSTTKAQGSLPLSENEVKPTGEAALALPPSKSLPTPIVAEKIKSETNLSRTTTLKPTPPPSPKPKEVHAAVKKPEAPAVVIQPKKSSEKTIPAPKETPKPASKPSTIISKSKPPPVLEKSSETKEAKHLAKAIDAGPKIPNPMPAPNAKNEKREKLLAQARDSIGKIQKSHPPKTSLASDSANSAEPPKMLGELQSVSFGFLSGAISGNAPEAAYGSELINRLKLMLHLPEYGDVDVELTLAKSGKVIALKILRDENRANRLYIENTMPTLSFPPFGPFFEGESQHTFVIRLTSQAR